MMMWSRAMYAALAVISGVLAACAPAKVTTNVSPALDQYQVQSVVVMPFARLATPQILDSADAEFSVPRGAKRSDIQMSVAPPAVDRFDRETTSVPPFAADKIADIMYRTLLRKGGVRVLSPADAVQAVPAAMVGAPEQAAKEAARQLRVDGALIGRVLVYREREGSRWGAKPAIVGFEVKLVAPDGVTLWTGNYYERQRPLNEDFLGFWQRGWGFVTAEDLAEYGASQLVKRFPFGQS